MPTQWYLRMEAVNLGNFVYDTEDLSTIRGGGHLLLSAVNTVAAKHKESLEKISSGASVGLFAVKEGIDHNKAVGDVRNSLNDDENFKHATFVVNAVQATTDYPKDRERVIAANRWQQMRSLSIAVPSDKGSSQVCEVDMIRPAVERDSKGMISRATFQRRQKGIDNKQSNSSKGNRSRFYQEISGHEVQGFFVNNLDEMTSDENNPLHHKMAVIYVDGNGFGKIQNDKCKERTLHEAFDKYLADQYKDLKAQLLKKIDSDPRWLNSEDSYRLETLLWGGDERMWVVPAWKGWELLQFFFDVSRDWRFGDTRLTHAAGIVFCHHKAPIHRITALARGLADEAKGKSRKRNVFAYQVLESFDHVGRDLAGFRNERCPVGEHVHSLVLSGSDMKQIAKSMETLRSSEFPTSRLHRTISALLAPDEASRAMADELIKELRTKLQQSDPGAENELKQLESKLGGPRTMWVHLAELWNYASLPEVQP